MYYYIIIHCNLEINVASLHFCYLFKTLYFCDVVLQLICPLSVKYQLQHYSVDCFYLYLFLYRENKELLIYKENIPPSDGNKSTVCNRL